MKWCMTIVAMAVLIGFGSATLPSFAGAQIPPPMPSPTDEKDKDKKPGSPRAGDDQHDSKKKDERSGR